MNASGRNFDKFDKFAARDTRNAVRQGRNIHNIHNFNGGVYSGRDEGRATAGGVARAPRHAISHSVPVKALQC